MFVHSLTTFMLSLSNILCVTFLASNEITSEEAHVKLSLKLKLADAGVLKNKFDSTLILEQCEQRGLLHFETEPAFTVLFS